ncbi:hypothetical protein BDZ89DRAFT_1208650 [Hymenopellis radicata]|nr:hypothetical protein BDZ89DRAFT_1208650 [Hymenopellis radicata]
MMLVSFSRPVRVGVSRALELLPSAKLAREAARETEDITDKARIDTRAGVLQEDHRRREGSDGRHESHRSKHRAGINVLFSGLSERESRKETTWRQDHKAWPGNRTWPALQTTRATWRNCSGGERCSVFAEISMFRVEGAKFEERYDAVLTHGGEARPKRMRAARPHARARLNLSKARDIRVDGATVGCAHTSVG